MVMKEIVRLQRNFLWVSWKKFCESKEDGGLGMIDLRRSNNSLLDKWIWRLGFQKTGLWKEILDSKYGGWRDLRSRRKSRTDSLWWRDLKEVWSFDELKYKFEDTFSWEGRNGREIRFWEDKWVGNFNLKDIFLRLFNISSNKDSSIWPARERSQNS